MSFCLIGIFAHLSFQIRCNLSLITTMFLHTRFLSLVILDCNCFICELDLCFDFVWSGIKCKVCFNYNIGKLCDDSKLLWLKIYAFISLFLKHFFKYWIFFLIILWNISFFLVQIFIRKMKIYTIGSINT